MTQTCIIIGGSHAGGQVAAGLRSQGFEGDVIVLSDEAYLPYHRPPLSKDFLSGAKAEESLLIRPQAFYDKQNINVRLNCRVDSIQREAKTVTLTNGEVLSYNKLVLATGARARKIPFTGSELANVFYLRDMADVQAIKGAIGEGKHAVIVGGGYIGLETAASLRKLGLGVTLLEAMPRILQRVTSEQISNFYSRIHTEEGVDIRCDAQLSSIDGEASVSGVTLADGSKIDADLVIIGVGVIPNTELAEAIGLTIENGIAVNEFGQTNDPDIYAVGDCSYHYNPIYDRHIRLESVQNANDQGTTVAKAICGKQEAYNALPWFWSDQYDVKLQIVGLSQGFDEVLIRGDIENGRSFCAFYYGNGKLLAADCINNPREYMVLRRVLTQGLEVDRAKLLDSTIEPNQWLS